jgi:energy-converting hydrogenase Eha subunit H
MNAIEDTDDEVRAIVAEMWKKTVRLCTTVLHQVDLFTFDLMQLPDPNIMDFEKIMRFVVCPLLDQVAGEGNIDPYHGMKVDNIRQYSLYLREIAQAIRTGNREKFDRYVELLAEQAMLPGD